MAPTPGKRVGPRSGSGVVTEKEREDAFPSPHERSLVMSKFIPSVGMKLLRRLLLGVALAAPVAASFVSPLAPTAAANGRQVVWQIKEMYPFRDESVARARAQFLRSQGYVVWEFVWDHHFC